MILYPFRVSSLGFRVSNDPNNRALGPKYCNINGIWALNPYYLGPWTLRATQNEGVPRHPILFLEGPSLGLQRDRTGKLPKNPQLRARLREVGSLFLLSDDRLVFSD